jgi:methenyltetrahydrofolate cyclohydrolase
MAARRATPGGGSAAALAGALGAAVGEMVLAYSVDKKDLAEHRAKHEAALAELSRARAVLLELMVEDQHAFAALAEARKNLAENGGKERFDAAVTTCIRVPQAVAATATAMLGVAQRIVPTANRFLLSDLAVCVELAMATLRCAVYNVRANLADVGDRSARAELERGAEKTIAAGIAIVRRVMPEIWKRVGANADHE